MTDRKIQHVGYLLNGQIRIPQSISASRIKASLIHWLTVLPLKLFIIRDRYSGVMHNSPA